MPAGSDYIRDERRRLTNLVAATVLFSESADGNASGRDQRPTLVELDHAGPIETADRDIHRKFQILSAGLAGPTRWYANGVHDVEVAYNIKVGYAYGGGDAHAGDWAQLHEVALEDADLVRQKIEHPSNFSAGGGTGITTGGTVLVRWERTDLEELPERDRLISVIRCVSRLRRTTETP